MKIVRLVISDIGGIEAFELAPDGSHVVIGGPNGAGKSTVLNAIAGALGGGRNRKAQRVRRGAAKGEVVVDLGDLVVRWRTTDEGRDYLQVEGADGAVYKSPQALLDRLWGARSFDPLEFFGAEPRAQAAMLAELAGVDLDAIERRRRAAFDERTTINRLAKELEAQAADPNYLVPEGTPDEPVDETQLTKAVHDAAKTNTTNAEARGRVSRAEQLLERAEADLSKATQAGQAAIAGAIEIYDQRVAEAEATLKRLREQRDATIAKARHQASLAQASAEADIDVARTKLADAQRAAEGLVDVDVAAASERLAEVQRVNRAVETKRSWARLLASAQAQRQMAAKLTAAIEAAEAEKASAIAAAALPIDGLGLEDGHVTWRGGRLESLSGSERLRVSVALGLARHPEIAVMLIDRWGDLDDDARRIVREMADAAGCQIITTVVGTRDEDITVTIREGRVASQVAASEPAFALDGGREPGEEG